MSDMVEIDSGWHFPWHQTNVEVVDGFPMPAAGSNGVIVNKKTGETFALGSAFSRQRDLDFYDLGYRSEVYDIVITAVHDLASTLDTLLATRLTYTELSYSSGTVWRMPQQYGREALAAKLAELPCIFPDVQLYFVLEEFHKGRTSGAFEVDIIGRVRKG